MKKLFVQFYLLLFVCFLVMTMLVGLVYKFTAERAGRQSLDDLRKSSLYLMRSELREIPPRDWSKTLKELDLNLSFDLHIEPISKFKLSESSMQHLRAGDIVALDDQYTFIQRIPRSHYVLSVGPVPYLYFLHEMRLLDVALMAFIAISLAFPVFIWMRPHWQDMLRIETAAQRFGEGHLSERIHFDSMSSFERLGVAFNQMADNINALIASKKQLIETFIAVVNDVDDVMAEWNTYVSEQREKELAKIIQEEKLKEPETRKYLANAFRDGEIKTVGTDIDKLMPPVSRFGGGGRAQKKQGVIDKLKGFFDKF